LVHPDDDEPDSPQNADKENNNNTVQNQQNENQRITRSKTHSLPKPIDRL